MSCRRNPRTSRISPSDYERNVIVDREFQVIEKFFWITGIIFTRSKAFCNVQGFFIACLDTVISLFYMYLTVATFYLAATGSPHASAGHAIINAISNFSGICVRFVLLLKRRPIRKCIDVISKLDKDVLGLKESKKMRQYLFWCCSFTILIPLLQMFFEMIIGDPLNGSKKYETLYLFGIPMPKQYDLWVRVLVILVRSASVVLCKSVPFLTVILFTFVFTRLRDINQNFITRLRANVDMSSPTKLFTDYTIFYGRITKTVEQVEKSLSLISFFLYGYILSCVFSVTSYLVTKPHGARDVSAIVYQMVTLVEIVSCFIFISMRAASVNESAVEVKNIIHTLPSRQFDLNPNLTATLLQLANNFANEVCMTGWGLFVINRSFILTTAGVVVSYGVILVQLGK